MSGMLLLIKIREGEYVLRNAQARAMALTMKNSLMGKTKSIFMSMNFILMNVITQPTVVPMMTPLMELAITRMKASYTYSFVILSLLKPIARITEISLHCSYKLPSMEEDNEKKQMNIVKQMMTLKIISR